MYEPYDPVISAVYLIAYLGILLGTTIVFIALLKFWFNHFKYHITMYYTAVVDNTLLPVQAILPLSVLTNSSYDLNRLTPIGNKQVYTLAGNQYAVVYYKHAITFLWIWYFYRRKHLFRTSQLKYTHPELLI